MNSFAYKKSIRTISLILFLSVILSVFSGCTQEEYSSETDEVEKDEESEYYPAATCRRCHTQWRANTTRARCIKEYGYCKAPWCERMAS